MNRYWAVVVLADAQTKTTLFRDAETLENAIAMLPDDAHMVAAGLQKENVEAARATADEMTALEQQRGRP